MACTLKIGNREIKYNHFTDLFDNLSNEEIVDIFKFQADTFNRLLELKKDPVVNKDEIERLEELNYFNSNNIYEANGISAILKKLDKEYLGRLSYLENAINKTPTTDEAKISELFEQYKSLEREFDKQQIPRTVKKIANALNIKSDYDFSRATGLVTTNTGSKSTDGLTDEQYFLVNKDEPLTVLGKLEPRIPLSKTEQDQLNKKLNLILRLSKGFPPSNIKALNKVASDLSSKVHEELHTKLIAIQLSDEQAIPNKDGFELTPNQEEIYNNLVKFSDVRFTIHSKNNTKRLYGFISKPLSSSGGNNLAKSLSEFGSNIDILKEYYKVYENLYNTLDKDKLKELTLEAQEKGGDNNVTLPVKDIKPTSISRVFPYKDAQTGVPTKLRDQYKEGTTQYYPSLIYPVIKDGKVSFSYFVKGNTISINDKEVISALEREIQNNDQTVAYHLTKRFSTESSITSVDRVELSSLSFPRLYDNKEKAAKLIYSILSLDSVTPEMGKILFGTTNSFIKDTNELGQFNTILLHYKDALGKDKSIRFATSDTNFSIQSIQDKLEELKGSNASINFVSESYPENIQKQLEDIYLDIPTMNNTLVKGGKAYYGKNTLYKFTSDSIDGLNEKGKYVLTEDNQLEKKEDTTEIKPTKKKVLATIESNTPDNLEELKATANMSYRYKSFVTGHLYHFILNTKGDYKERLEETKKELNRLAQLSSTSFNDPTHRFFQWNALTRDEVKKELLTSLEEKLSVTGLLTDGEIVSFDTFETDETDMETQQYEDGYQLTVDLKSKLPSAVRKLIASLPAVEYDPVDNSINPIVVSVEDEAKDYFELNVPADYHKIFNKLLNHLSSLYMGGQLTGGKFNSLDYMLSAMVGYNINPQDKFLASIEKWDTPDADIINVGRALLNLPIENRNQIQTVFFNVFSKFKIPYLNFFINEQKIKETNEEGKEETKIETKNYISNASEAKMISQLSDNQIFYMLSKYQIIANGKSTLSAAFDTDTTKFLNDADQVIKMKSTTQYVSLVEELRNRANDIFAINLDYKPFEEQFLTDKGNLKQFIARFKERYREGKLIDKDGKPVDVKNASSRVFRQFKDFISDDSTVSFYVDGKNYFQATNESFLYTLFKQLQNPEFEDPNVMGWQRKDSLLYKLKATLNIGLSATRRNSAQVVVDSKLFRNTNPLEGELVRFQKYLANGYNPIFFPDTLSDATTELNITLPADSQFIRQPHGSKAYLDTMMDAIKSEIKRIILIQKQSLDPKVKKIPGVHNQGELKGNGNFFINFNQLNRLYLEQNKTSFQNLGTEIGNNTAQDIDLIIQTLYSDGDLINSSLLQDSDIVLPDNVDKAIRSLYYRMIKANELGKNKEKVIEISNKFLEYKPGKKTEQDYFRSLIPQDILNHPQSRIKALNISNKTYREMFETLWEDFLMKQYLFSVHYRMFAGDMAYAKPRLEVVDTLDQLTKKLNTLSIDISKRQKRYVSAHQHQLWMTKYINAYTLADNSVTPSSDIFELYDISEKEISKADSTDAGTLIMAEFFLNKMLSSGEITFGEFMHQWAKHDPLAFEKRHKEYKEHPAWEDFKKVTKTVNGKRVTLDFDNLYSANSSFTLKDLLSLNYEPVDFSIKKPLATSSQQIEDGLNAEYYDKNAEYTILPNTLDKDSWLSKLHASMVEDNVMMTYFKTARKLASPEALKVDSLSEDNKPKISTVDLEHYGLQVVVPVKESNKISMGSQPQTLALADIESTDIIGVDGDNLVTGKTLIDEQYNALQELYTTKLAKINDTLKLDESLASVNNLFGRSLKSLGFSSDEITNTLKLHNGKYNTPLSFSNLRLKLIAILKKEYNKLFKQKATGHSYVLAPEEYLKTNFYKPKRGESIVPTNIKNSISWVSQEEKERFERINGLSYFEIVRKNEAKGKEYSKEEIVKIFNQYDELEKIADKDLRKDKRNSLESTIKEIHKSYEIELPRVILPAFFQVEGKTVDIKKYVNSEGYLDTDRIPVEALTLFGFRIPYQSKGSGAGLKVAGFLPYEQKDTLFLPQEMIPQTGTDFDVDKFFVYFKNLEHNYTSTLLKRIKSKFKDPKVLGEVFRKLATEKDIVISSQLRSDITMFLYELQEDNLYSSLKEYGQIEGFNDALLDTLNFFNEGDLLTIQDLKESTNIDHSKVKFNTATDSIANAENKLLDVYLKSFSLNTIKDIIQPLGNDEFEAASREISTLKRQGKELTTLNVVNDLNSYHYQKELYENNNFGKTALGIFVVGSIMNEVMRRNNPTIFVEDMKVDGKLVSYGNKYTLDGSIKKSKQFMQSSNVAVDVAKLGSVLKDSGITSDNISFVTTMMMFGLTFKQIFHIINSNPFKDYIASISSERTLLGLKGRIPNPIRDDIDEEVGKIGRDKPAKWNKYFKVYVNSDFNALNQLDSKGLYHFYKFLYFTELHGKRINQYISSFDGYRKGLPSTIIEVLGKISKIDKLSFIEKSEKVLPFILEDKNFPTIYHNGYTQVMNSVNQLFPEYRRLIPEIIDFVENSSSVKDRVIKEDALKKIEEDVVKYFTSGIVDTQKFKDTVGLSFTIEGVSRLYAHYPKIALNKLIELLPVVKNKITLSTSFINNLVIKTENNVNNILYEVNKELNYDHKKELYSYLVNPDEDVDLRKVAMLIVALRYTLYSDQYSNAKFKDLVGFETEELIGYPEYTRGLSDQLESQELTSDLIYQLHMNNTDLWNTETNDKTIIMPDKDPFLTELRRNQIPFIVQPSSYSKFSVINTNYYVKVRKIDKENSVFLLVTPNTGRLVSKIKYNGYFEEAVDFRDINNKRNSLITSLIKEANLVEQLDEDSLESEIDQEIEYTEYVNPIPELRSRLANAPEHYKIFLEVFSPYLEDLNLEIGTINQYNPNNNTITLAENSSDHVSIQHELIHALTVNNMERWSNSSSTKGSVENMIGALNILVDKLSPIRTELLSLKEALSSNTEAKTLRSIVTDFLENNPSIESFITGMGVNVNNGDIATLTYSLSYLTDPITNPNSVEMFEGLAALSEPLFQELTSKIEYNGKSLLQTLVEKLRNLINSLVSNLGIEANENTVLINLLSDMYSLIDKDDLFETKEEKNEIKIPKYIINYNLINKDGSKRFASTNGKVINLNPVKTIDEFFDYFEGKEGGESSVQKLSVLNELSNKGYSLNKIKNILNSVKKINTFLILHEKDHIDNNDIDIYWKNGKDLLTKDKIDIEVRATLVALKTLENQTYSTLESQINYIEIEQKFKLRNLDGSRKRYSNFELLNSKVKKLNISNPEFKFRIGKVMGEKGDFKTYYSIFVESKTNPTTPLLTIESNKVNELNENNTNEGEYSNKHGRFGKLIITGSGYKFLPSDESPFSLSTDKQESIYTGNSNGSNQSKDTKEIQKQDFARRVFNKLLYSESWYASAYKEITRVFPETSVVFIDQREITETFIPLDGNIIINLANIPEDEIIPSNGRVIDNPVKPTKLTKTSFKYISNPEINPYKFTPDKGGYSDVISRLKSRLITLKITDKNMVIKDPNMFSRLQESWTNQAEKLYNLVSIPKVMIEDNGKVKFRDYLFNEIDYKNGVITESNKSSGDRIKLEEAGLSQQNINHFFNNYFNESHTYSDGSSSESVNKEFSTSSYIEFINKRQRTNLDANSFNTIGEYINELNRLALEPNDISIGLLSSEEVDKRACKR